MMHKAWCSIEEVPYCFPRPPIKFQGHKGQKIDDLDQTWARLLGRSQLSNPSDLPCWNKVNIGNVNCARATAFIFDTPTDVLVKVSKFLRQKISRPERDSNPQPSDSCRMLLTIWAISARHLLPMFFNTGSGGIDIFTTVTKGTPRANYMVPNVTKMEKMTAL